MHISLVSKVQLGPAAKGYRKIDIRAGADSSALVPVVMAGWPCVKVNLKGLFVSEQQPPVGEMPEGGPE